MVPSEQIFEFVSPQLFKEMGNNVLKHLKVALLPKVTIINDKEEIAAILLRYHDDPAEGGHTGITRTYGKIKRHFYWKKMKQDITYI